MPAVTMPAWLERYLPRRGALRQPRLAWSEVLRAGWALRRLALLPSRRSIKATQGSSARKR